MTERNSPHDAEELSAGRTANHRTWEIGGITVSVALFGWLAARVLVAPALSGWWMPLAALIGILLSDFTSGFVHWLFDTWGDLDTPVFGRIAIRTFRHHHVDQKAITTHDFIETNGCNFALTVIYTVIGLTLLRPAGDTTLFDVFVCQSLLCATVFTAFTSQIHKWAHMETPPKGVLLLQRARLLLSPTHHSVHHSAPYNRNYCITVGWMNGPLRAIRFFETLERTITAVTGAVPREDDLGKDAAPRAENETPVS